MSDIIQSVGEYDQTCDEQRRMKARVVHIENGRAFGFDCDGDPDHWDAATGEADSSYDIKGPWIPDPPEPPAGFVVMPKEYVAKDGDKLTGSNWQCGWQKFPRCFDGMSAADIEATYPSSGTHWIASPIPKPFSISEHGPGVYARRDGVEANVDAWNEISKTWSGRVAGDLHGWFDDGKVNYTGEHPGDLVRYLRPLPKPTVEWTPTNELRLAETSLSDSLATWYGKGGASTWRRLEQKWTCGEKSEWRPVGVEP